RITMLALRYLTYLVALPRTHYAMAAFQDAVELDSRGVPSWVGDLRVAIRAI
ncbi:hypothetical protein OF83DRAFT_1029730, partial [Amylostereum chailletii]